MADGLTLGDPETLPKSIEKVADLASQGLLYIAQERGLGLADAVRQTSLERLFRVGANLDRETADRDRTSYADLLEQRSLADDETAENDDEEP